MSTMANLSCCLIMVFMSFIDVYLVSKIILNGLTST